MSPESVIRGRAKGRRSRFVEWRDEEAAQESTRRGPRQIGWLGPERGQTTGQSRERPQRRLGQKPQEENCRPAQRQAPTTWTPEEGLIVAVAEIRSRFGYGAIGLGRAGIRYSGDVLR